MYLKETTKKCHYYLFENNVAAYGISCCCLFRSASFKMRKSDLSLSLAISLQTAWRCSGCTMPKRRSEFSLSRTSERPRGQNNGKMSLELTYSKSNARVGRLARTMRPC